MRTPSRAYAAKILSIACCLGLISISLSACQSNSQTTHFYVLNATEKTPLPTALASPQQLTQQLAVHIELSNISLPQYLQRPQMVQRTSENTMQLLENEQWAGSLRKNIKRTLAENLAILLNTSHIQLHTSIPDTDQNYRITLDILQFETLSNQRVSLLVQWTLNTPSNQVHSDITRLLSKPVSQKDYPAHVHAMSQLLGQLSQVIATQITTYNMK